jgi:hypothetical protein
VGEPMVPPRVRGPVVRKLQECRGSANHARGRASMREMRGRSNFGLNEIHAIEHALRQMSRSDTRRRRLLQRTLRRHYRFYASDFAGRGRRLTADDLERLIAQGVVGVR